MILKKLEKGFLDTAVDYKWDAAASKADLRHYFRLSSATIYSLECLESEGENLAIFYCTGSRVRFDERIHRTWNGLTGILFMSPIRSSLRTADAFPLVASLPPKNSVCEPERQNNFPWRKTFLANHGLALKIKELTRENSRKIVCGGYVSKSKLKGRRSLCIAALFPQNEAFTKVNLSGLWDWLMK